jgi:hypothetical protein
MSNHYNGAYNKRYSLDGGPGVPRTSLSEALLPAAGQPSMDVRVVRVSASENGQLHASILSRLWEVARQDQESEELERHYRGIAAIEAIEIGRKAKGLGFACLRDVHDNLSGYAQSRFENLPGNAYGRLLGHWSVTLDAWRGLGVGESPPEVQLQRALAAPDRMYDDDCVDASRAVAQKVSERYVEVLPQGQNDSYQEMVTLMRSTINELSPDHAALPQLKGINDILLAAELFGPAAPTGH